MMGIFALLSSKTGIKSCSSLKCFSTVNPFSVIV